MPRVNEEAGKNKDWEVTKKMEEGNYGKELYYRQKQRTHRNTLRRKEKMWMKQKARERKAMISPLRPIWVGTSEQGEEWNVPITFMGEEKTL